MPLKIGDKVRAVKPSRGIDAMGTVSSIEKFGENGKTYYTLEEFKEKFDGVNTLATVFYENELKKIFNL